MGLKEIKSLSIVNKNVALKNNRKEILLLNIFLSAVAEEYKETIQNYLYWQWLTYLVSGKRPENEQKVLQGKNGEDGLNWYAYVNNDPVNFTDPLGLTAEEVGGDGTTPEPQVPDDPFDYHCDINSWNQAIEQGYDPTPPGGNAWDGNDLTVDEISDLYPDQNQTPEDGTAGFGFINNDEDEEIDHMIFYDNTDENPNTYTAYDSDGIDNQTEHTWSTAGTTVTNGTFVPLEELNN